MRRKILMGVLALALPAGTVAFTQTMASAKAAPPNPVTCTLDAAGASVTISPPLSAAGTLSVKGGLGTTTITTTYSSCHDSAGPVANLASNTFVITSKAAKDKNYLTDGNGVANKKSYYLGLCSAFSGTSTTKALAKGVKGLTVAGGILKGMKAIETAVGSDVGFVLSNGTVKGGTYPTASKAAAISAGLVGDNSTQGQSNTSLVAGCTSPGYTSISHIYVDSSQSTATL
jgi:hypothetical protein